MTRPLRWILTACLLAAALSGGCGDDEDGPVAVILPEGKAVGRVLDADGEPVEGARVAVVFGIDGIGLPGWDKRVLADDVYSVTTVDTGRIRLEIQDYLHQTVHLFLDETKPPGTYEFTWDLTDAAGDPVPTGGYFLHSSFWSDPEAAPQVRQNFLLYYESEPAQLWERHRAVTDAEGRWEVDLAWFPLGESVHTEADGWRRVSSRVRFVALRQVADSLRTVQREMVVADRRHGLLVDLSLP